MQSQIFENLKARAAEVAVGICPDGSTPAAGASCSKTYNIHTYFADIYSYAFKLGSVLVILMLIYGGYVYMTSQGDSTKLNTAKDRVVGAVLGYILLYVIGAIMKYIGIGSS